MSEPGDLTTMYRIELTELQRYTLLGALGAHEESVKRAVRMGSRLGITMDFLLAELDSARAALASAVPVGGQGGTHE